MGVINFPAQPSELPDKRAGDVKSFLVDKTYAEGSVSINRHAKWIAIIETPIFDGNTDCLSLRVLSVGGDTMAEAREQVHSIFDRIRKPYTIITMARNEGAI